jgi:hypothetical protein
MSDPEDFHELSTRGEAFSLECSFTWINPGPIEAGESNYTSEANLRCRSKVCRNALDLGRLGIRRRMP